MSNNSIQKRENSAIRAPERIEQSTHYTPLVDIAETQNAFLFEADLPGVKAGDVEVSYENGVLTIAAKVEPRQPAEQQYIWQDFGVGTFYRQFTLRTPINVDAIRAEMKNGELRLTVPKTEAARSRKIQVKSS